MSLGPWSNNFEILGQDVITWERVTSNHIRKHILREEIDPELDDLAVFTNIKGQLLPGITKTASATDEASSSNRRNLEEDPSLQDALIVQFDVQVTYRSISNEHDVPSYIFSAWDTPMDRDEYIRALTTEANKMNGIENVLVEVEGFVPPPKDDDSANIAVIIGAAVGGAALVFLIAFFLLKRGSGKELEENHESTTAAETAQKIAVST